MRALHAVLVASGVLLMLALSSAADSALPLPGNRFSVTDRTLFLSPETGSAGGQATILLLDETAPAQQNRVDFVAPGVDMLGVVVTPSTQSWYSDLGWDKDLEIVEDSWSTLYFQANVQSVAVFTLQLYDVAPDGTSTLIEGDEQQFVTALSPNAVEFQLHTAGLVVRKDHVLRYEVAAETANVAVILLYGGDTPSALESLQTRWLDSDGDGMPDSDEVALGRNPLNANDAIHDSLLDTDGDGISDKVEAGIGTDPRKADSDGDGFSDGIEVHAGTNPRNAASKPYDVNHNGLPDTFETNYFSNTTSITPTPGPCTPGPNCIDPNGDPDGDGCDNLCEAMHGTDPNDPDSDNDGISDGAELNGGSDPSSANSILQGPSGVPEPIAAAAAFAIGSTLVLLPLIRRP